MLEISKKFFFVISTQPKILFECLGNEKGSTAFRVSSSVSEQKILQEVSQLDSFRDSDHKPVVEDPIFEEIHRTPSYPNGVIFPRPAQSFGKYTS